MTGQVGFSYDVDTGVSNLLASLGHTGRRVVLGHTLNTSQYVITHKKSHNVLSKFTILCWATFIAILGLMQPAGHGLDTPKPSWLKQKPSNIHTGYCYCPSSWIVIVATHVGAGAWVCLCHRRVVSPWQGLSCAVTHPAPGSACPMCKSFLFFF